jgi:outer membrane lipoprotein
MITPQIAGEMAKKLACRIASAIFPYWIALLFSACAPVISPQLRQQVNPDLDFRALAADPLAHKGEMVMLGGTIVQTVPRTGETEIEVLQKELSSSGEPRRTDRSEGRFLTVAGRFLDPAIYKPERDLTVAGRVVGSAVRRLGEIDYRYPVVAADELYLWPPWPPRNAPGYPYTYPHGRWRYHSGFPWWP